MSAYHTLKRQPPTERQMLELLGVSETEVTEAVFEDGEIVLSMKSGGRVHHKLPERVGALVQSLCTEDPSLGVSGLWDAILEELQS